MESAKILVALPGLPRNVFIPSLFIFTAVAATVLLSCSIMLEGRACPAGIITLALCLFSVPFVYVNSLRGSGGHAARRRNAARVLALVAITAVCCVCVSLRIIRLLGKPVPPAAHSEWTARVLSVTPKRYFQEAEVLFQGYGEPTGRAGWQRGLVRADGSRLAPGDLIRFGGKPARAAAGLRQRRSMLLRGIRSVWYLDDGDIAITEHGSSFREAARGRLASDCDTLFSRETAAVVKALYFGNQDYIDRITINDFKRAGVLHILSASGLHGGVGAAIPLVLLGFFRVNRNIIMAVAAFSVLAYLYMTDMPVSLLRACVMFSLYAAQRLAGRDVNIFNTLFLSAAAIVMALPHELFGLGFQLSYGATLGILLFHGAYRKAFSRLPSFIASPLALTLSAQAMVFPVILAQTGEVNLAGPVSNIVIVPLMSLLLVVSIAANSLSFLAPAASLAGGFADIVYGVSLAAVRFMSGLGCHFYVEAAGAVLVISFCMILSPLVPGLRGRRMASLLVAAGFAAAWLAVSPDGRGRDCVTRVTHRQGTLLVVKNGAGVSVIGQYPDRAQADRVAREIATAGREVNLYIPHPDYRNIAGCSGLLKRLPVRRCFLSGRFRIRGYIRRFFDLLQRDGVDLVIQDGTGQSHPGTGGSPAELAGLYALVSAGSPPGGAGAFKNYEIRYLTLH